MPKYKKPPKNDFTFFMEERKKDLEAKGYRFKCGMKDVAAMVGEEWRNMTPEEKEPYKRMAKEWKEKEKNNLENKFTCSGESYAALMRRRAAEEQEKLQLKELFRLMVTTEKLEDRIFMIMHAIPSCEVALSTAPSDKDKKVYYPLEFAIAAFSLRDGLICSMWSLVNTEEVPTGFLSDCKQVQEDTWLPLPGSAEFREIAPSATNYEDILGRFRRFVETWGYDYPDERFMIFAADQCISACRGTIDWLVKNVDTDEESNQEFYSRLRFYSLPLLYIELCSQASSRDAYYESEVSQFRNVQLAQSKLAHGRYDYKMTVTCPYHLKGDNSQKMHLCCANFIQRRIFLMLDEFVKPYGIPVTEQHKIDKFRRELPERLRPYLTRPPRVFPKRVEQDQKVGKSEKDIKKDSSDASNHEVKRSVTKSEDDKKHVRDSSREGERRAEGNSSRYQGDRRERSYERKDRTGRDSSHEPKYHNRDSSYDRNRRESSRDGYRRSESGYDRDRRDSSYDRKKREPSNGRDRRNSSYDRTKRESSYDRAGRGSSYDRRERDRREYGGYHSSRDRKGSSGDDRDEKKENKYNSSRGSSLERKSHGDQFYVRDKNGEDNKERKPNDEESHASSYSLACNVYEYNHGSDSSRRNSTDSNTSYREKKEEKLDTNPTNPGITKLQNELSYSRRHSVEEGEVVDDDVGRPKPVISGEEKKEDPIVFAEYQQPHERSRDEPNENNNYYYRRRSGAEYAFKPEAEQETPSNVRKEVVNSEPSTSGAIAGKPKRDRFDVSEEGTEEWLFNVAKKRRRDSPSEDPYNRDSSAVSAKSEHSDEDEDRRRRQPWGIPLNPGSDDIDQPIGFLSRGRGLRVKSESPEPEPAAEEPEETTFFVKPPSPSPFFNPVPRGRGRGSYPRSSASSTVSGSGWD